jgi:hypothetical protein
VGAILHLIAFPSFYIFIFPYFFIFFSVFFLYFFSVLFFPRTFSKIATFEIQRFKISVSFFSSTCRYITDLVCFTYFHWFFSPECQHIFGKQTGYIFQFPKTIKTWTTKHYASLNQWYNTG